MTSAAAKFPWSKHFWATARFCSMLGTFTVLPFLLILETRLDGRGKLDRQRIALQHSLT
jgi:hypothetical protein